MLLYCVKQMISMLSPDVTQVFTVNSFHSQIYSCCNKRLVIIHSITKHLLSFCLVWPDAGLSASSPASGHAQPLLQPSLYILEISSWTSPGEFFLVTSCK